MIWNNKQYRGKPLLIKGPEDQLLQKHRRWYSQFYSENSPTIQSLQKKESIDWWWNLCLHICKLKQKLFLNCRSIYIQKSGYTIYTCRIISLVVCIGSWMNIFPNYIEFINCILTCSCHSKVESQKSNRWYLFQQCIILSFRWQGGIDCYLLNIFINYASFVSFLICSVSLN